jgi:pimeloyl-ACP methyl ester carboxylesterase
LFKFSFLSFGFKNSLSYFKYSKYAFNAPARTIYNIMKKQRLPEATTDYHKELTQKCLVIEGGNDNLISLENSVDFCKFVPNCYLAVIDGLSHMSIIEQPLIVNEIIEQFLAFDA